MKRFMTTLATLLALLLTFSMCAVVLAEVPDPDPGQTEPAPDPDPNPDPNPDPEPDPGPSTCPPHDYSITIEIFEQPTCGKDGEGEFKCSKCGDQAVLPIPKTGNHDYSITIEVFEEATCGKDGEGEFKCSVCGDQAVLPIPKTGNHDYSITIEVFEEATCGKDGEGEFKCSVCGDQAVLPIPATGEHKWDEGVQTKAPTYDAEGEMTYTCTVCKTTKTETIPKLTPTQKPTTPPTTAPTTAPTQKPSSGNSNSGNNNAAPAAPAATEAPAVAYGSIVSDIERADEPYVPETVADETGANTILVITADPDEDGTYTLRNLHITDALLAQLNNEGILTVRFVVGDATVEFPVASFTGEAVTTIKGDLDSDVAAFLVTVDPNATTADGQPGVSVGSSVITSDAAEYDVTPLIPDLNLTIGDGAAQPVTTASVYTANASAAAPVEEPAPVEEAPAEPAVEEAPAEPALEDTVAA